MISATSSLILFLFFPIPIDSQNSILEQIEETYECEPNCWYREPEITYESIMKWPKNCTEVCGMMSFSEKSTIPVFELIPYFEKLKVLKGQLSFGNTKYASIEFLSNLNTVLCDMTDISFYNNVNLEQLNFGNLTNVTCDMNVNNNKKLDANVFCEKYEGLTIVASAGNLKNCAGCQAYQFYSDGIEQFRECTLVTSGLSFFFFFAMSQDPTPDLSAFGKIQNVTFGLDVYETDLYDLKFLKSLELIRGSRYATDHDIRISKCRNMTRFGIPNLKQLIPRVSNFRITVEYVHDDFCFTTSEFKLFMEQNVVFTSLEAKFCEDDTTACVFKTMKDLGQNCTDILGNITISWGDEEYVNKLKNVKGVWGSITIQNTNLTDLSFLGNLEYVATLNDSRIPIQIKSNELMTSVEMLNLKRVFSRGVVQISLEGVGDGVLDSSACLELMENLFETIVTFDGKQCEAIDRTKDNGQIRIGSWKVFLYILLFSAVI